MGQLRMALRAYAMEQESPAAVVARVDQLVHRLGLAHMATLAYLVFDPDSGAVRFANAGHPPPLVIGNGGGGAEYIRRALAPQYLPPNPHTQAGPPPPAGLPCLSAGALPA